MHNQKTNEDEPIDRDLILAFYSHASRGFNSAVAVAFTYMALAATILIFTKNTYKNPSSNIWEFYLLGAFLWLINIYLILRVVEMNIGIQFLEKQIRSCNGKTSLLCFVNRLPRLAPWLNKRLDENTINRLVKLKWYERWKWLNPAHWALIGIWTVLELLIILI